LLTCHHICLPVWIAPIAAALLSGLLGGAYTWHYNRHGKRTPLRALRYRKHR
jgi:hypothetical protein